MQHFKGSVTEEIAGFLTSMFHSEGGLQRKVFTHDVCLAINHNHGVWFMSAKKTSTITFRIDGEYERVLRNDAETKMVSLNTLANQIFGHYVEWQRYVEKFGSVVMSKYAFKAILETLDEQAVINLATRIGEKTPKELLLFKLSNLDVDNVLKFTRTYIEHCGYGQYTQSRSEGRNVFSVHHDLGRKGSLFLKALLTAVIRSTLGKTCESTLTENSLLVSF